MADRGSFQNVDYMGVPPESAVNGVPMPIQLVPQSNTWMLPSTKGQLISCTYRAVVEMDLPMCPDISVRNQRDDMWLDC